MPLRIPLHSNTRWGTAHKMLDQAYKLRQVSCIITFEMSFIDIDSTGHLFVHHIHGSTVRPHYNGSQQRKSCQKDPVVSLQAFQQRLDEGGRC